MTRSRSALLRASTVIVAVVASAAAWGAAWAQSMSMTAKSSRIGEIRGDLVMRGVEGRIEVTALSYALPGGAGGEMVTVTTPFGRHLPLMLQAHTTNEVLGEVIIEIRRPDSVRVAGGPGTLVKAQTIRLRNVRISAIRAIEAGQTPAGVSRGKVEMDLRYGSIEFTHDDGGVTFLRESGR